MSMMTTCDAGVIISPGYPNIFGPEVVFASTRNSYIDLGFAETGIGNYSLRRAKNLNILTTVRATKSNQD